MSTLSREPLISPEELAEWLSVEIDWVYKSARKAGIPVMRIGKYLKADPADVRDYLSKKKTEALAKGQKEKVNG